MNIQLSLLNFRSRTRQSGVTLLELSVVIFVGMLFVGIFYKIAETQLADRQVSSTRDSVLILSEAIYNYRLTSHDPVAGEDPKWPGTWADLQPYVPAFAGTTPPGGRNGVGQAFVLNPPANLETRVDPYEIVTDLLTPERANKVAWEFPGQATVSGTQVTIEIPIPGHEPARDALLARDGTRPMEDALDMDGNPIENVDTVFATQVNLDGEPFTQTVAAFINTLNGVSCSSSQSLSFRNGGFFCTAKGGGGGGGGGGGNTDITYPSEPDGSCGVRPSRPTTLNSRATWACTQTTSVDADNNDVCVWSCSSGCGSGDALMPQYETCRACSTPPYASSCSCDDCQSRRGNCSNQYSTTAGTCGDSSCRYTCVNVR